MNCQLDGRPLVRGSLAYHMGCLIVRYRAVHHEEV